MPYRVGPPPGRRDAGYRTLVRIVSIGDRWQGADARHKWGSVRLLVRVENRNPARGFRTLAALAALRDSGTEILYIAGNHDCWGGEVLREDVGADYMTGPWQGEIGPWKVRIEHGDGLRETEDRKYRMVRPIMRSPLAIRLFRSLHPDWATRLASGSSSASRTYAARDGGAGLRAIAHARLSAEPELNLVVLGHSHVATLERVGADQVFANAGSWLDAPTYLEITNEAIALLRWTGSAERDSLYVINR